MLRLPALVVAALADRVAHFLPWLPREVEGEVVVAWLLFAAGALAFAIAVFG